MADRHAAEIADVTRGWGRAGAVRAELKRLPERLTSSEQLVNVDRAESAGRTGLLAVTNARMLFLSGRLFKTDVEVYPFEGMRALHTEPQLFGGTKLIVDLESGPVEFKKLEGPRAQRIVEYVQSRLREDEVVVPVTMPANLDQLKRDLGMVNRAALWQAYRRLPDVLQSGESLGPGSYATREGGNGLLLATDRRLLFVPTDVKKRPEIWRYHEIRAIELKDAKTLNVFAGGRREVLSAIDEGRGHPIVQHVRPRLSGVKSPTQEVDDILSGASDSAGPPAPSVPTNTTSEIAPPGQDPTSPAVVEPLDLNTAAIDELQERLGLERATAARAVDLRDERGGFASPDDFADAIDLPPHLRAAVRSRATAKRSKRREGPHRAGEVDIG